MSAAMSDGPAASAPMDVVASESRICVLVEVPGVEAESLRVSVVGNRITVSGEKPAPPRASESGRYLCLERQWGRFERTLELPGTINPREGRALLGRGLLRIEFPIQPDQRNQVFELAIEKERTETID